MKNTGLKIISLVAAVLLSYFVNSEGNSSVFTFMAPVEVRSVPPHKVLDGGEMLQAHVTLRGPSFVLSRIPASPPVFRVSVPAEVGNTFEVRLQGSDLALPPFVDVVSIQPGELALKFDDVAKRAAPINVPLIGAIDGEMKIDSIVVTPEMVEIRGAKVEIDKVGVIQTEALDVRGVRRSFTKSVPLRLPSGGVHAAITEATVEVRVSPVEDARTVTGVPVEVRSLGGENYALTPPTVSIEVVGRRALIEKLDRNHVIPFVRLSKEYTERELVGVSVELPEGLRAARVDPAKVEVIRSPRGAASRRAETAKKQAR